MEEWVVPYHIPDPLLTYNDPQLVGKFFNAVCVTFGTKLITTTAYHPQMNGQTERFNNTKISRVRHYISKQQEIWDTFVQPLTNGYNAQTHATTKRTPFGLTLTREPPTTTGLARPSLLLSHQKQSLAPIEAETALLDRIVIMRARTATAASEAQQRYKLISADGSGRYSCLKKVTLSIMISKCRISQQKAMNRSENYRQRRWGGARWKTFTLTQSKLRRTESSTLSVLTECLLRSERGA